MGSIKITDQRLFGAQYFAEGHLSMRAAFSPHTVLYSDHCIQRQETNHLGLWHGHTLRHTLLHTAPRSAGLPHTYRAGVTSAFRRAMIANRLVASFLNLNPFLVNCLTMILTNDGHHSARKQMTTNTMMRSDSFLLSLSALGASRTR